MSYEVFKQNVNRLIEKAGIKEVFYRESEDGRYFADADGVTIIGRKGSLKVTVRYGSGHQSMATL